MLSAKVRFQQLFRFLEVQCPGPLAGWLDLRPGWLGLRPGWMAQRGGQTDGRTDVQTYRRKISPFYRTSFPIGAAAQKNNVKNRLDF